MKLKGKNTVVQLTKNHSKVYDELAGGKRRL